jgi:protein-glutamine gamma-glutamyltransferase
MSKASPASATTLPYLARLHLAATYVLLTLGTTGLWLGEPSSRPLPYPLFTAGAALLAFYITDRPNGFQMPIIVCNLLAVVILCLVAVEFSYDNVASVVAMAHFLVYLQIVKFFRRKSDQDVWQLYGLNLLQLAIACVLNRHMSFGVLLVAYAALGVFVLMLFHLKRLREAPAEAWTMRGLARPWLRLTLFVLPAALIAFWITPRTGQVGSASSFDQRSEMRQLSTGFSTSLELNEMQKVMENSDVVFNVWANGPDGKPTPLPGNLLWRGQVFVSYRNNSWSTAPDASVVRPWDRPAEPLPGQVKLRIQQVIRTNDVLFSPKPLFWARAADPQTDIEFVATEGRIRYRRIGLRDNRSRREPIVYSLIVGIEGDFFREPEYRTPPSEYLQLAREIPPNVPQVVELARQICAGVSDDDIQTKIQRLTDHFERDGGYSYTLDLDAEDASLDRLEDFVVNRKRGHCEYFSTALAVMLRAVGVPTRVVTGFKGADFNDSGGYYQVRELLAHSWVEAYIASEDRWQSLDPTPNELRNQAVELQRSPWQGLWEMTDAASNAWATHFVGYSNSEQREAIAALFRDLYTLIVSAFTNLFIALPQNFFRWNFWMSFQGISAIGAAALLYWAVRKAIRVFRALRSRAPRFRRRASTWPLFRDWNRLVASLGFERKPSETPREFARRVAETLGGDGRLAAFNPLHLSVVDAFYANRYGGRPDDGAAMQTLRESLHSFRRASE